MSAVKISRVLGRRLRWAGLAGAALLACAAPSEDGDSSEGAATTLTNCEAHQNSFIHGAETFGEVRDHCNEEVTKYTDSQPENFDWFKNQPLGVAGPPVALLLAMMDDTDIWPPSSLGLVANTEKEDPKHPRLGLPYGLVYVKNPDTHLNHAFFSCAGCHTGRVVGPDNKVQLVYGAPNTEVDAQMFGWRVRDSMLGRPGSKKEGYVVPERVCKSAEQSPNCTGDYVLDEEGFPKFTMTESGKKLEALTKAKIDNPGIFRDITEWGVYTVAWKTIIKKLVAGAVKTDTLYGRLPKLSGSYPEDARSPKNVGPRPGMMDAYGFGAGLVYTHANREDYFAKVKARYGADYRNHPFFAGLVTAGQTDADLFAKAKDRIQKNPAEWFAPEPAPVDVKSLFNLADRPNVGWDGNQATSARVIASGTSSVGDPWNVNVPIHKGMDGFIKGLPAAAYPFEIDASLAKAGAPLFKANCASCHKKGNDTIYKLAEIKTDPNRANVMSPIARAGLIELMRQTCDGTGNGKDVEKNLSLDDGPYKGKPYSNDWCTPKGPNGEKLTLEQQDNELFRKSAVKGNPGVGYKADDLRGIWVQAPYLHNGSVPTLWHLLNPSERPKTFARGNINYDQQKGGFAWNDAKPTNYPTPHVVTFDTALRGQSNAGHTYGSDLKLEEKRALVEYLKTL